MAASLLVPVEEEKWFSTKRRKTKSTGKKQNEQAKRTRSMKKTKQQQKARRANLMTGSAGGAGSCTDIIKASQTRGGGAGGGDWVVMVALHLITFGSRPICSVSSRSPSAATATTAPPTPAWKRLSQGHFATTPKEAPSPYQAAWLSASADGCTVRDDFWLQAILQYHHKARLYLVRQLDLVTSLMAAL